MTVAAEIVMRSFYRQMYLDTNVWSDLAKGALAEQRLKDWLRREVGFLVITGTQLTELAARPDLAAALVDTFYRLPTVLLERKDEVDGDPWVFNSGYRVFLYLSDHAHRDVVVDEFLRGPVARARQAIAHDAEPMRSWVQRSLSEAPPPTGSPWSRFPALLDRHVQDYCASNGAPAPPAWRADPRRYRGIKLQFAMLFARFYVSGSLWKGGDYHDYLHCRPIAYADAVVTERALAAQLSEAARAAPQIAPPEIYDIRWLRDGANESEGRHRHATPYDHTDA